jgi:hypothetical protein
VRFIEAVPISFRPAPGWCRAIGRKDNCFETVTHQALVEMHRQGQKRID